MVAALGEEGWGCPNRRARLWPVPGAFTSRSSHTTLTSAHGCSLFLGAFTNHLCYFCAKKNNIKMSDGCAGGSSALGGEKGENGESLKITVGISRSLSCCLRCPLASAYLSVTRSSWHLSIHLDPCQSVCLSNYPLARQSSPRQRSRRGRRETTAAAPRRGVGAATPAKHHSCGSGRRWRAGKGLRGCRTPMPGGKSQAGAGAAWRGPAAGCRRRWRAYVRGMLYVPGHTCARHSGGTRHATRFGCGRCSIPPVGKQTLRPRPARAPPCRGQLQCRRLFVPAPSRGVSLFAAPGRFPLPVCPRAPAQSGHRGANQQRLHIQSRWGPICLRCTRQN